MKSALSRVAIIALIIALASFTIAGMIWTHMPSLDKQRHALHRERITENRSISATNFHTLNIKADAADVTFHRGTTNAVSVALTGFGIGPHPRITLANERNTIAVGIKYRKHILWESDNLHLDITIPRDYHEALIVKTISGDITLTDAKFSSLNLTSTSGHLRLDKVHMTAATLTTTSGDVNVIAMTAGNCNITSTSGDIYLGTCIGDCTVRTTSGDVCMEVKTGNCHIDTISGNVNTQYLQTPQVTVCNTTSGDISLVLPHDAAFAVTARSTSGDISCAFPIELSGGLKDGGEHRMIGKVGAGNNRLEISSTSGDIAIEK